MLFLKLMSEENKPDSNTSKKFNLLCVDNVHFERNDNGKPFAVIYVGEDKFSYELKGNAYVLSQYGKTIASFAYSEYN